MLHEIIDLNIDYSAHSLNHDDTRATLELFILDNLNGFVKEKERPFVLICPGGGYQHLSPREAEPIAIKLASYGFHTGILRYSITPNIFPSQILELDEAFKIIRSRSKNYQIAPNKLIVAGFSAGAHVAACCGTLFNTELIKELGIDGNNLRPDAMMLAYPVITSNEYAHRGSFVNLLGKDYDKYVDFVSLEKQVDSDTPPCFIWHTFADQSVPLENSLLFANALRKHQVKFEYHVFPNGAHGLALANEETETLDGKTYQPECSCWCDLFKEFVNKL